MVQVRDTEPTVRDTEPTVRNKPTVRDTEPTVRNKPTVGNTEPTLKRRFIKNNFFDIYDLNLAWQFTYDKMILFREVFHKVEQYTYSIHNIFQSFIIFFDLVEKFTAHSSP